VNLPAPEKRLRRAWVASSALSVVRPLPMSPETLALESVFPTSNRSAKPQIDNAVKNREADGKAVGIRGGAD
jgi:hypothetical protein